MQNILSFQKAFTPFLVALLSHSSFLAISLFSWFFSFVLLLFFSISQCLSPSRLPPSSCLIHLFLSPLPPNSFWDLLQYRSHFTLPHFETMSTLSVWLPSDSWFRTAYHISWCLYICVNTLFHIQLTLFLCEFSNSQFSFTWSELCLYISLIDRNRVIWIYQKTFQEYQCYFT